jgi:nickel/cobalt exporter
MLGDPSRSWWVTMVAIGLAMMLGAFHALTPGHGKTIMAAYLVGTGGRVRDALALGASVTVTHTSSVLVIGVLALFASRFVVPSVLVPTLEVIAGAWCWCWAFVCCGNAAEPCRGRGRPPGTTTGTRPRA